MLDPLKKALECVAYKGIKAHGLRLYKKRKQSHDYRKRTGLAPEAFTHSPSIWGLAPQFNPFKVRKKSDFYFNMLEKALVSGRYSPLPALNTIIPKPGGRKRVISQYACTDAAISRWLYQVLTDSNNDLISDHAYAFRKDRNSVMAAEHIIAATRNKDRMFIVEYDFKNFFDEINHVYLLNILDQNFTMTSIERFTIERFIKSKYASSLDSYRAKRFKSRLSGIPQGSTVSLFLANAVCFNLDRDLESLDVTFARFADDVIVVCNSYDQACKAASAIHRFSRLSGVPINEKKSDGISLLSRTPGEIKTKQSFDFLGYSISQKEIGLSSRRKNAIKRALSQIVYETLLKHPKKGKFNKARVQKGADWDVVVCLNQLRKRIYGRGLTENLLNEAITIATKAPFSIVGNHPLVNTDKDLIELDGWLLGILVRAIEQRHQIARKLKIQWSLRLKRKALLEHSWYDIKTLAQDTGVPSLRRSWLYSRKFLNKRGIRQFLNYYDVY